MHCGAEDDEYYFDSELYCGICAQQLPHTNDGWLEAFRAIDPEWLVYIEQELNRIGGSKSGLRPEQREALARAVDAFGSLRRSGSARAGLLSEDEYAGWLKYACTYFKPPDH
jgi:hypothetical protein